MIETGQLVPWHKRFVSTLADLLVPITMIVIGMTIKDWQTTSGIRVEEREVDGSFYLLAVPGEYPSTWAAVLYTTLLIAAAAFYFWNKGLREGSTGQSLGKAYTHQRTLDADTGQPIGRKAGLTRAILLPVDTAILLIGVLWPIWDQNRQTLLSDKLTNAIVVEDYEPK